MNEPFDQISPAVLDSLFNKSQFRADLTIASSPVPAYKKCLKEATCKLEAWFIEGIAIEELVLARAWLIDQVLRLAWEHLPWNQGCPGALLAVGG